MASELATGLAIIDFANKNKLKLSMLVISNESKFLKKAKGLIRFECDQVKALKKTLSGLSKNKTTDKIKLKSKQKHDSSVYKKPLAAQNADMSIFPKQT